MSLFLNLVLAAGLFAGVSGCAEQPPLFSGAGEETVRAVLPVQAGRLFERDTVRLEVRGRASRVQLLLLDSTGTAVLWRSGETVPGTGGTTAVAVDGVPAAVERGAALMLTASVTALDGSRYYASDDTGAARTLAEAAKRRVVLYAGRRVAAWQGPGVALEMVVVPELRGAVYVDPASGGIASLDLSGGGSLGGGVPWDAPAGRLAYRDGILASLAADGGAISFFRATADGIRLIRRAALPALELESDTTLLAAARPTGRALGLTCGDPCAAPVAVVASELIVLKGAVPGVGPGVLRILPADSAAEPRVVLPAYGDALRGDSAVDVRVFGAREADGSRALLQAQSAVSRCLATALGQAHLAGGSQGSLYVGAGGAAPPCGPGTRILRVDGAVADAPVVSALAVRNTVAEARLGPVQRMDVSEDGSRLLVVSDSAVAVADRDLHVLGSIARAGLVAVTWLRGAGAPRWFAVSDSAGATVYDGARMREVARLAIGPTAGPLVFLHRTDADVLAAAIPGGFVVAPMEVR